MTRLRAWDLYADGFWIGTVSRPTEWTAEQVKRSLEDWYPRFTVVKPASSRNNRKRGSKC